MGDLSSVSAPAVRAAIPPHLLEASVTERALSLSGTRRYGDQHEAAHCPARQMQCQGQQCNSFSSTCPAPPQALCGE